MAVMVRCDAVSKSFGARPLLSEASLSIEGGERVALIGDNGTGKSTLLRLLTGAVEPDAGTITLGPDVTLELFEQVPRLDEALSVKEALEGALAPLRADIARYEELAAAMDSRAEKLMQRIERAGGWEWKHRVEEAAQRVGLPDLDVSVRTLSGGYRRRVALARLLLGGANLLLLDEPTNHLDTETIEWMESWIQDVDATFVLVTHDRYFLDRVATSIVELRRGNLVRYQGNYSDYLEARTEEEERQQRTLERRARLLAGELQWARRQPKARGGKSKSRLDRIDAAVEEQKKGRDVAARADFRLASRPKKGGMVLEVEELSFAFEDGPELISDLTFGLERGDRLGVVGPNGTGKTTLLRLLRGDLEPASGRIRRGGKTDIGYFDQERATLSDDDTVRGTVLPQGGEWVHFDGNQIHALSWLKRFGFEAEAQDRLVKSLSGGERNRLAMATFLLEDANLLLLDEPTNDLDLFTIAVLEDALLEFPGAVVVVSHDRYFLDRVVNGIIGYEPSPENPGKVAFVKGNYRTYHDLRLAEAKATSAAAKKVKKAPPKPASADGSGRKALTYAERLELEALPAAIEKLEAAVAETQERLSSPDLWTGDQAEARELQERSANEQEELAKLYARWEELEERA